jgi:hypothetical protein
MWQSAVAIHAQLLGLTVDRANWAQVGKRFIGVDSVLVTENIGVGRLD